jgi:hypothetical protein
VQGQQVARAQGSFQVDQCGAARSQLVYPPGGEGVQRAGGDDPVEGGVLGESLGSVAGHQRGVVAQLVQSLLGGGDEGGVDVDRAHGLVAEPVAEQCGVVAGAGADLQHPMAVVGSSLFQVGLVIKWVWLRRGGLAKGVTFRWLRDCP